jgi:hypothetical protein
MLIPLPYLHWTFSGNEWRFLSFRCPLVNTPHLNPQLSTACSVDYIQDISLARTPRKTPSSVVKNACLLARYLAVNICEPHKKRLLRHWLCCCVHVFRALPRNGSTCHNINCLGACSNSPPYVHIPLGD